MDKKDILFNEVYKNLNKSGDLKEQLWNAIVYISKTRDNLFRECPICGERFFIVQYHEEHDCIRDIKFDVDEF